MVTDGISERNEWRSDCDLEDHLAPNCNEDDKVTNRWRFGGAPCIMENLCASVVTCGNLGGPRTLY